MEFLKDYFEFIIIGICLCVGYIIKNILPGDKINRYIPLIMGTIGLVLAFWLNRFVFTPQVLLGGLVSGLASTGLHQTFKIFIEKGE